MSFVCGRLDLKDAESHLEMSSASCPNKFSNGSNHVSGLGSEDAQESDGDDSGYIHHNVNEESNAISNSIPESLPLKSLDDDRYDNNSMFSESMDDVTIIPAIKGSREKHGKSLQKLSVSWAEDVYDPPPSIVSHTRSTKQQPQKSRSKDKLKKNGKKGQKGSSNSSSSRGSKDKKQISSRSSKYNRDKVEWETRMPIVAASS